MNPARTLVVTGFDARHFDLAQDMVASFRRAYQDRFTLAAIVFGHAAAPPALAAQFDRLLRIGDAQPFDPARGYFLAYAGLKAKLRELFPGFDAYVWVDSDCWFQGDEALPRILHGVREFDLCIHPEADVHYLHYPTPTDRTLAIYRANEAARLDAMPLRMPMVNAGVFAMRADSRVWSLWAHELDRLRQRYDQGEPVYCSDQIPLHKLIYQEGLSLHPIRAQDNWQLYACLPALDRASGRLHVPTAPFERLGLIHLAGASKDQVVEWNGQPMTWRYRDVSRLWPAAG